ncbi:MAG TPA: hypothetical protein ENJ51_10280, partial [Leucothrix mucor]|nr:hypothetical protein [Leucothrix mucor]
MMKKKLLSSMVGVAVLAMFSGNSFAAAPTSALLGDVFGDSLINLPVDESTVTTDTADIWFVKINEAYAYSVDIVGAGKNGDLALACDNAVNNQHRTMS